MPRRRSPLHHLSLHYSLATNFVSSLVQLPLFLLPRSFVFSTRLRTTLHFRLFDRKFSTSPVFTRQRNTRSDFYETRPRWPVHNFSTVQYLIRSSRSDLFDFGVDRLSFHSDLFILASQLHLGSPLRNLRCHLPARRLSRSFNAVLNYPFTWSNPFHRLSRPLR